MSDNAHYSQKNEDVPKKIKSRDMKRQEIHTSSCNFKPQFPTPRPLARQTSAAKD
jgi:hypothetical protein